MDLVEKKSSAARVPAIAPQCSGEQAATLPAVGNWEWDFETGVVTWSDGVFRLLGLEPRSVAPSVELWASKLHPEDRAGSDATAIAALKCGVTIDHEFRVVLDGRTVRWAANKGEVFANATGQPSWAAGMLFDITDLREAQMELARREERYKALVTATSIGEWRADAEGTITSAPFWASFTGQPTSDADCCEWLKSVHPDDVAGVTSIWEELIRIGCSTDYCFRLAHRSGEYRWVHAKAVPLKNIDGTIREWVGTVEDIHDKRRISEHLRVHENRQDMALSTGRMVAWDYDFVTGHVTRSENSLEILGVGSGHLNCLKLWIHPEDVARVCTALDLTAATGSPYDLEYRMLTPNGETRWLRGRGKLLRTGRELSSRIFGVTVDVTEQKRAALEARKLEGLLALLNAEFAALKQVAGDIVWTASADGRVTDMPAWRQFTGQTIEEVQGWRWLAAVHPSDRERVREGISSQIESNGPGVIEYRVRSRSGQYRWFIVRSAPVLKKDGGVSEWLGACTELSSPLHTSGVPEGASPLKEAELTTGCQIRAARAILRWSVRDLAEKAGVSGSTIRRIEDDDGLPQSRDHRLLCLIRSTLEEGGVRFGPVLGGKCGVGPA
jgi:PAS domain S-box-containing protein